MPSFTTTTFPKNKQKKPTISRRLFAFLYLVFNRLIQILRIKAESLVVGMQNLVVEKRGQVGNEIPTVHCCYVVVILGILAKELVNVRDGTCHSGLALGVAAPNGGDDEYAAVRIALMKEV